MQKSDFLKNIKLQSSTTEACDWDGDDSACPFRPAESSEFFIRTATKMSCANTAATNFLKEKKLSYLDLKITDIMDSRSRAQSVLSRDRNRRDYAKFKGEERVTFSLVAWTIVESIDSGLDRVSGDDGFSGSQDFNFFERGRYDDIINGHVGGGSLPDKHKGIWLQKINRRGGTWDSWIKMIQGAYFLSFKGMKWAYDSIISGDHGHVWSNPMNIPYMAYRNDWISVDRPLTIAPLAHRVHVIAYDDDVMPNAGEALLRCADEEAGIRGERKDFDPDKAFDRRVCLNHDDWRRAKVEKTSGEIAKMNKRLIKSYFAKVYDPESRDVIYRPWEANPDKNKRYSEKPSLVYATYFAVQSCHTGVTDIPDAPFGGTGTAYSRIKLLKEKITTREGQQSLKETFWRNRAFEGFGGLDVWSCEPRGSFKECECHMKLDHAMKNEYYFGIKRWNPRKTVQLTENHGGDNSDLTQLKCFRALEKSFSDPRGAEYYNCGYYMGDGGREGAVLSDENQHKREKIREYCKDLPFPGVPSSDDI